MRHYIPLTREIDLHRLSDRRDLYKILKSIQEFHAQIVQIKNIIKLFVKYLSNDWLILRRYPVDGVVLEVGNHKSVALNIVDDIFPLGSSLLELRSLGKFQQLINKLNFRAHDRLSAVIEAIFSAKYKKAKYHVCLEPTTKANKRPDFKVKSNKGWIHFECKVENYFGSESFQKENRYFNRMASRIKRELGGFRNLAIELKSRRLLSNNELEILIQRINNEIQRNSYGNKINCHGIELVISKVQSSTDTDIQISQSICSGTIKDRKRIRNLLNNARNQIPLNEKGVIIIKTINGRLAISIAREILSKENYHYVSAIIVVESGEGEVILNKNAASLPSDFLEVALSRPLPSYLP